MDSPQGSSPSINDSTPSPVQNSATQQQYQDTFRIGLWLFTTKAPRGRLISILDKNQTLRDFTYLVVVDKQLQDRINGLQVNTRRNQSVALGEGVYRIADIMVIIYLICEQQPAETCEIGSLPYKLWNGLDGLKERLAEELEWYQEMFPPKTISAGLFGNTVTL